MSLVQRKADLKVDIATFAAKQKSVANYAGRDGGVGSGNSSTQPRFKSASMAAVLSQRQGPTETGVCQFRCV